MDNYRTPLKSQPNFLENLPIDIRKEITRRNQVQSSPFRCLPNHTTPPSRYIKIRNPFEAAINERLHSHIFSPSVFAEVQNPRSSEKFKWTIDDVSSLRPAHIDVSTIAQFEPINSDHDDSVQAKIEKYFSETHIVPSPWNPNQETMQSALISETEASPIKDDSIVAEVADVWTQTVLTLPPKLPEEVEKALKPFFTFTEDQRRQTVDMNSSLCRRLFHFDSPGEIIDTSCSSVHSKLSSVGSPIRTEKSNVLRRNFDNSPNPNMSAVEISPIHNSTPKKLNDCQISPISKKIDTQFRSRLESSYNEHPPSPISLIRKLKSRSSSRLDFSGHMSVDTSFNMVPENDVLSTQNTTNLSESPVRTNEYMENSCNWDVEYNSVSLNCRSTRRSLFESRQSTENMDISNLTTPKSKIISSQRKKLSDSFKLSESLSDDELINIDYIEENQSKIRKYNICDKNTASEAMSNREDSSTMQNTQDTGYNTCSESQKTNFSTNNDDILMSDISNNMSVQNEKENWNTNIFASTPSKRYFHEIAN